MDNVQIDPRFIFWFGVWTNILLFVASYGVDHAPQLIQQYAPTVQWVCGMVGKGNSVLITAFVGLSSNKVGVFISGPK